MWNVKESQNIRCWNCDHFQRYDSSESPHSCLGECRLKAPFSNFTGDFDSSGKLKVSWPLIISGPVYWCGQWERSTEKPLPSLPTPLREDRQTNPTEWDWCEYGLEFPDDGELWEPWNRKLKDNVMCWNCDHFQREDASEEPETCKGWCRKNPPGPWISSEITPKQPEQSNCGLRWAYGTAFQLLGPLYWCSEWERATHNVPPYPERNGKPCFEPKLEQKASSSATDKKKKAK